MKRERPRSGNLGEEPVWGLLGGTPAAFSEGAVQQGGPSAGGTRERALQGPSGIQAHPAQQPPRLLRDRSPSAAHILGPSVWTCPRSGHMAFVQLPRAAVDPREHWTPGREELSHPSQGWTQAELNKWIPSDGVGREGAHYLRETPQGSGRDGRALGNSG